MVIFYYWVSLILVNLTLFKPLVLVHLKTPILDQRGKDGPWERERKSVLRPLSPEIMNSFLHQLDSTLDAAVLRCGWKTNQSSRPTIYSLAYRSRCDVALLETQTRRSVGATFIFLKLDYTWVELKRWRAPVCRAQGPRGFVYTWITCIFR